MTQEPDKVHDITSFAEALEEHMTHPVPPPEGPPSALLHTYYWHVFGGPLSGSEGAAENFPTITYGPNPKAPDNELRAMTLQGTNGETFRYLASFTHDPTDEDLRSLRPKEYK